MPRLVSLEIKGFRSNSATAYILTVKLQNAVLLAVVA
jgi:hypothetical protein